MPSQPLTLGGSGNEKHGPSAIPVMGKVPVTYLGKYFLLATR